MIAPGHGHGYTETDVNSGVLYMLCAVGVGKSNKLSRFSEEAISSGLAFHYEVRQGLRSVGPAMPARGCARYASFTPGYTRSPLRGYKDMESRRDEMCVARGGGFAQPLAGNKRNPWRSPSAIPDGQ